MRAQPARHDKRAAERWLFDNQIGLEDGTLGQRTYRVVSAGRRA